MSHFLRLLFLLCVGHALADYPLQGDFLAKGKNMVSPLPGIHAGAVYLITGRWYLAVAEFILHWLADGVKCHGVITFNQDQAFHYLCKALWAGIASAVWLLSR